MDASRKLQWFYTAMAFGIVYGVVGIAFPNPPSSDERQFLWRLAAWLICAVAFAIHIVIECLRTRSSAGMAALHVSASAALGAFVLAIAANIHALTTGTGNQRLLGLALLVWPIGAGVAALAVAWVAAAGLAWLGVGPKKLRDDEACNAQL